MNKKLTQLKDRVWMTRKARINASERLLSLEKFIQYINIYYSCFICILSVYGLVIINDKIGIISTILSIILTISMVYLNSQRFGDRAQQLKNNYINLQKLYLKLDNIDENTIVDLTEYNNEYIQLLSSCENHSSYDYYKVQLMTKQNGITSKTVLVYNASKTCMYICGLTVILVPILLALYIFN